MNKGSIWNKKLILGSLKESFKKLNPLTLISNPVMLVVEIGSIITTIITIINIASGNSFSFNLQITIWLWFTLLFANFAEAFAQSQGKARADSLKKSRSNLSALKLNKDGSTETISASI